MKLYFSSLMYSGAEFKKMLSWIKKYPGKLGVEIFVMFHEPEFETVLGECEEELKSTSVSFHEPYWDADHSYPMGTDEYVHTMEMQNTSIYENVKCGIYGFSS